MANSLDLVLKFQSILDALYKRESLTARMDSMTQPIDFAGAATVKVMKLSTVGLGNYSRSTGYPKGDITATWEAITLNCERGREFSIDRMDSDESLAMVFGNLASEFIRTQVAPEVDAYRFAKYASTSGIQTATAATLDKTNVLAALDTAKAALNANEVPADGRILYISDAVLAALESAVTRQLANDNAVDRRVMRFDNMEVIMVPQTRFYTQVTLDAGATSSAGGYSKTATTGKDVNFMIVHPSAVLQATKLDNMKYFAPEVNQKGDGHLWQYRLYHDAYVYDNHRAGRVSPGDGAGRKRRLHLHGIFFGRGG